MSVFENRPLSKIFGPEREEVTGGQRKLHGSSTVVPPDPLSTIPSTSSAMKTPENTEKGPDDPEPADEGDIQMEHSSD
jgi:hypothetical protein